MLSSPGSDIEPTLLEVFVEKFANGRADGLREDHGHPLPGKGFCRRLTFCAG